MRVLLAVLAGTGLLGAIGLAHAAADPGFVRLSPGQIEWRDMPDTPGVRMAVLAGDPSKPGPYVIRVRFPPHVMDRPHTHAHDRYVTVLNGLWFTGTGDVFDPTKAVVLPAGGYMFHPAGAAHWDGSNSDQEAIVQITGVGPEDTKPVDPDKSFWVTLPSPPVPHVAVINRSGPTVWGFTAADIERNYPASARAKGIAGQATIRCTVRADGRLYGCAVVFETPPGNGFGEAGIKILSQAMAHPSMVDGKPVDGGVINVPFRFSPG